MKHYVFCCSSNLPASIERAKKVVDMLDVVWSVDHDVALCSYHSGITVIEGAGNTEIFLENNDISQLISDCMEFASSLKEAKMKQDKINKKIKK